VIIIRLAILVLTEAVVIVVILPFRLFLVVDLLGRKHNKHAFEQRRVSPPPRTLGRRRQEEQSSGNKPIREG
jgi:hypothetical protein